MAQHPRTLRLEAPEAVTAAMTALREGGLVAIPTETVYGLACALDPRALGRLVAAKARPIDKGITLLVDGLDQARTLALIPDAARRLAERFWPGPLTLVLPMRPDVGLPDLVTGSTGAVGLRVPDLAAARQLAAALGPLPLTSANRSGEPDATTAAEVVAALGPHLALVLDGGPSRGGVPSTVVAVSRDDPVPRILRAGALSPEQIAEALQRP